MHDFPPIQLTDEQVQRALAGVQPGLNLYRALQALAGTSPTKARERDFQRRFNAFYVVRRGPAWQQLFYPLLEQELTAAQGFDRFLDELHARTGRVEASFASKAVATAAPDAPILDAFVLLNLGIAHPPQHHTPARRIAEWKRIHAQVTARFSAYLTSPAGDRLVAAFEAAYPASGISRTKMLDFVLWQLRG